MKRILSLKFFVLGKQAITFLLMWVYFLHKFFLSNTFSANIAMFLMNLLESEKVIIIFLNYLNF